MTSHRSAVQPPAGWHQDPWNAQMTRYHDGQQWTSHTQPVGAPAQPAQTMQPQMPTRFVTKERKDTSHVLHLILTILTLGVWGLFVWLPITLWHKMGPKKKTVTVGPAYQQMPQQAPQFTQVGTPAGWYPAPDGVTRYWDGQRWTEHTQP